MKDLIAQTDTNELIAALRAAGPDMPMPFERDILLLDVEVDGVTSIGSSLEEGENVRLIREPDKPDDAYAIRIDASDKRDLSGSGAPYAKLGYVPKPFDQPFARLMDAGKYLYGIVGSREAVGGLSGVRVSIMMRDDLVFSRSTAQETRPAHGHSDGTALPKPAGNEENGPVVTMKYEALLENIHSVYRTAERLTPYLTPIMREAIWPESSLLTAMRKELSEFAILVSRECGRPLPRETLRESILTDLSEEEIETIAASYTPERFAGYLTRVPKAYAVWNEIDHITGALEKKRPLQAEQYLNALKSLTNILFSELMPLSEDMIRLVIGKLLAYFNRIQIDIDGYVQSRETSIR